jgi:phosphoglycolate phosphatase
VSKIGFLFLDLDGTIADSGAGITGALNQIFESEGIASLTENEARWILGPSFQSTMPTLLERRNVDPQRSDEFIDNYRALYKAEHLPRTQLISGMGEALDELARHFHLSIVTAKPKVQADIAAHATDVARHMVTVVGPDEKKPQPKSELLTRAILEVTDALGHAPQLHNSYMIGDRHHDIDAAIEVGTHSIGVLWGYGDRAELETAGATHVISDPVELLQLLIPR